MSVTIKIQPQEFQPVYNQMMLVLDSNKKTETNFKFVVDVNIGGTFSSRIKMSPNPDGYAVVDLHKHIEPFVNFNINHTSTDTFQRMQDSFVKYDVSLSEEYLYTVDYTGVTDSSGYAQYNLDAVHYFEVGDKVNISDSTESTYNGVQTVSAVADDYTFTTSKAFVTGATGTAVIADNSNTLITGTTVMSGDTYAFNGSIDWLDVPNWDVNDYKLTGSSSQFISTIASTNKVKLEDRFWSNIYNDVTGKVKYLEVQSNNGLFRIENDSYLATSDANKFLSVGLGAWNIANTTNPITSMIGTPPIIDSATTWYSVVLTNIAGTPISETLTFNIDSNCSRFENYRMIYLDKYGSFLSVSFDLAHKKKVNVKKQSYKKNFDTYNPTTNTWGYDTWSRGQKHLDSNISETYTITTNWVNETTGQQVIDLIESPEVYHLSEDGNLYAVNILTTSLTEKQRATDKLFNYTIDFEYSFKNGVQRG